MKSLDSLFSFPLRTSSFGIPSAFQKPDKRLGRKRQSDILLLPRWRTVIVFFNFLIIWSSSCLKLMLVPWIYLEYSKKQKVVGEAYFHHCKYKSIVKVTYNNIFPWINHQVYIESLLVFQIALAHKKNKKHSWSRKKVLQHFYQCKN